MPPFNNAASAPSVHAGAVRRSSGRAALAVLAALAGAAFASVGVNQRLKEYA
jgi:hypothetical protein